MNSPDHNPPQRKLTQEEKMQRIRGIREWLDKEKLKYV